MSLVPVAARVLCKWPCARLLWLEAGAALAQALSALGTRCQKRLTLELAE